MSELIFCPDCRDHKEYLYDEDGFCVSVIHCDCPLPPSPKILDKVFPKLDEMLKNGELFNAK